MRRDVTQLTQRCLVCNSYSTGHAVRSPLTPIPVGGLFDQVGVNVIQFPRSHLGNQYAIMCVGFLTKWQEVYPAQDQFAATIANLLI